MCLPDRHEEAPDGLESRESKAVDPPAFVDLEDQPSPVPPARDQTTSPVLELVRWRQARTLHSVREDPSVVGNKAAQGDRWTPIGEARAALDRTRDYREDQASGFVAIFVFIVAGPARAIAARVSVAPSLTLAGAVVLSVIGVFRGWTRARVQLATTRLWEAAVRPRWPKASDMASITVSLALLAAAEFAIGFAI